MPTVSHDRKEVLLKIVYYGPGLGGKTTNLQYIHQKTKPELRGKLINLATETERTLFFDLLPVDLGSFKGYTIRLHLCTVPGQIAYDRTRQLILRNVDGIVFVVDSQPGVLESNLDSILNLETNLRLQGQDPSRLPLVVQYNKRDLKDIMGINDLRRELGIPSGVPEIVASARLGHGVFETLKTIVKSCISLVGNPSLSPAGRFPAFLDPPRPGFLIARPSLLPPAPDTYDMGEHPSAPRPSSIPRMPTLPPKSGKNWLNPYFLTDCQKIPSFGR
jgi:mutual gliding-motility protein MglA